jgi:hypothetical protein
MDELGFNMANKKKNRLRHFVFEIEYGGKVERFT